MTPLFYVKVRKEPMSFPYYTNGSSLQISVWKSGTFAFSFPEGHFLEQHLLFVNKPFRFSCIYFYTLDSPVEEKSVCVCVGVCMFVCV